MAIAMEVRETEVVAKATPRRFTAEYKRKVLQEAERAKAPGEIGALPEDRKPFGPFTEIADFLGFLDEPTPHGRLVRRLRRLGLLE